MQLYNYAIAVASRKGHLEVMKRLMMDERVDPSDVNNRAYTIAKHAQNKEMMELLMTDARVRELEQVKLMLRKTQHRSIG